MKYLTPKGLTRWSDSTVRRILKNEKYKGDVLQGKTYTTDPITHKRVINMGEENQYYIKEHHTAIIEPELFDKVQQILEKRAGSRSKGKRREREIARASTWMSNFVSEEEKCIHLDAGKG